MLKSNVFVFSRILLAGSDTKGEICQCDRIGGQPRCYSSALNRENDAKALLIAITTVASGLAPDAVALENPSLCHFTRFYGFRPQTINRSQAPLMTETSICQPHAHRRARPAWPDTS